MRAHGRRGDEIRFTIAVRVGAREYPYARDREIPRSVPRMA